MRRRSGVLLSWRVRSRTVRKVPAYQPTNLPGQRDLSADLPSKECVKEGTNQPTLLVSAGREPPTW
jgi:hypothetical protein